jgi:hypothetical protein
MAGPRLSKSDMLRLFDVEEALEIVTRYFDAERLPAKTRFALEELLPG